MGGEAGDTIVFLGVDGCEGEGGGEEGGVGHFFLEGGVWFGDLVGGEGWRRRKELRNSIVTKRFLFFPH